jgi:hypothetical protein
MSSGTVVAALLVSVMVVTLPGCGQAADPATRGAAGAGPEVAATLDSADGVPRTETPCGGSTTTLDEALAQSAYDVRLPASGLIADREVSAVYDCPGSATFIVFGTGATLSVGLNGLENPAAAWEALAEENPKIYSVGDIGGIPANFIDPAGDLDDDALGGVTFVRDGLYIAVGGDGKIPLTELVEVANSLDVTPR